MKNRNVLLLLLSFALFISCGKKEEDVIKIGVLTTLTGESAKYGKSALDGIQLAVDEINNKGGIENKKIKTIIEDDGSENTKAVSAFTKLANIDKVAVIIGPISSSAAMVCSPIANNLKVVLFSPSAATPLFTSPQDFTFRNRVSSNYEIIELANVAYSRLGLRRIAILYVNNDYGLGNKNVFEVSFEKFGGKIVDTELFTEGSSNLRDQLLKIQRGKPNGIFLVGQGTEGGYALKQAKELGLKTQFLSTITIQRSDVLQIAGKAADGVIYALPTFDRNSSKKAKEFEEKYKNNYNTEPDIFSGNGYDAVYIVAKAIELGGYTAEGIKSALFKIKNFDGVTGNTTFDSNGDVTKPIAVKIIKNNKFINFN